ncbi:hypothetical protein CFIO01_07435 [Colletotrichum fioriniae PJ7]|uniref:Uncharacterized protein n=1 Tax=Colletotrichum fioriniae PJ7 TaxID=1445577 RepID=A0A010RS63_9PEZI|nr:hypothetical protein CFIO01_07435 [Colletotrichum fioriniae PJ7]
MVSFTPTMQVQDDLATLFSRNLTFNPEVQPKVEEEVKQSPEPALASPAPTPAPIIYSITQHYTHSAHVVRQQAQEAPIQRPSSEPPQTEQLTPEAVLSQHGVNPSVLSPSQIQLFRCSEEPHQLRLLEIWRAAPPTSSTENPSLAWTSTTLEQEEQLARLRYERMEAEKQQQEQQQQQNAVMSLDGTQVQSDDSRWLASSITSQVEPYMMSGYEELMRREYEREQELAQASPPSNYSHYGSAVGTSGYKPATDPVYKGFGDDWAREHSLQMQMQMENQYGAFQHYGSGNIEAMDI